MNERPLQERIGLAISLLMSIIYTGGGIFLIASSFPLSFLPSGSLQRYAMAVLLLLYGIYRGQRGWKQYKG